jgi:acetyl-CoA acyltransferase
MTDIVIIDAVRTPVGRRGGWLRGVHPVQLGAHVVKALLKRTGLPIEELDHVLMGCVTQAGEQTFNLARNVVLDAGLPIDIPATTLDFQCGSSQQAVHLAAAMVASGHAEVVIAGGVESMTRVPMGSSLNGGQPFTPDMMAAYNLVSQGVAADEIAQQWGITRAEVDAIGFNSHRKAAYAAAQGWFSSEIAPLQGLDENDQPFTVDRDQGIRINTDTAKMATLQPAFTPDGVTTAGNSSQISDGAAAVMVTTSAWARKLGLKPRARIAALATVGSDPHLMLTGPIPATQKVLARAGLSIRDIDLFEVNEAFAAVIAMWEHEFRPDMTKVNVHGGAIALGHPLGASGARLMTTLLNALETHDKRLGLQTMCCGGGMGTGTIIERLD